MDTFKSMMDKISEGLNFFDFSFFVSGFVTYITLLHFSAEFLHKTIDYTSIIGILTSIILSYVCGIVSFTMGKWIRSWIRKFFNNFKCKLLRNKSFDELLTEGVTWILKEKNITKQNAVNGDLPGILGQLVQSEENINKDIIYSAMWIEIRKKDTDGIYYRYLYRQWVMQAVCEGLLFSFLLISTFSLIVLFLKSFPSIYICSLVLSLLAFIACCREARRYAENQIKEVVISYYFLQEEKYTSE